MERRRASAVVGSGGKCQIAFDCRKTQRIGRGPDRFLSGRRIKKEEARAMLGPNELEMFRRRIRTMTADAHGT